MRVFLDLLDVEVDVALLWSSFSSLNKSHAFLQSHHPHLFNFCFFVFWSPSLAQGAWLPLKRLCDHSHVHVIAGKIVFAGVMVLSERFWILLDKKIAE